QPSRVNADLIDALSATTVVLPPLRERAVDIPLLATSFLAAAAEATETRIDSDAMAALERHTWPGNVAELRAVIERARLVARGGVIRPQDLALGDSGAELELSEVERRHIVAVLDAKEWHQGKAAEALGISPKTLYRKIREYGLRRPATEEGP
ncbi:MAG TPA: helix-turn-helix domain-containing protein, partial [Gemmatimonadaceae bacterium]|nr:helix-turn-helix domain-containing protein [Gemmatimonadaceae bacterium]